MKYMLIEVVEREIVTETFDTYEDAYKAMENALEEVKDSSEDYEIDTYSAWANADGGDMNCDWKIVELD